MARSTKLAQSIAEAIGEPASRVQGWIERGLGPDGSHVEVVDHFRHLAPLLGTGRDDGIAALKMAADGYPCRCLRDVLAHLARQGGDLVADPDELVEHLMSDATVTDLRDLMTSQARKLSAPVDWAAAQDLPEVALDEPELADITVRAAVLPIADLLSGNSVEPLDTAELDRMGGWEQLGMSLVPFDDETGALNIAALQMAWRAAQASDAWIANAPTAELAQGVAAARVMLDALASLHPGVETWRDEHRWGRIGWLAPVAAHVLPAVSGLFDLAPEMEVPAGLRRFVEVVKSARPSFPARDEAGDDDQA